MAALLAAVLLRASSADGGLSVAEIDDVVGFHAGELEACRNPKATGTVETHFTVVDGGVAVVAVKRDSSPGAASCFARALYGWEFPVRAVGTAVMYEWSPAKKPAAAPVDAPLTVLRAHRGEVSKCWVAHRKQAKDEGPLELDVVIGASGAVLSAQVRTVGVGFAGTPLAECVLAAARTWRFPAAKQQVQSTLKFTLVKRRANAFGAEPDVVVVTELEPLGPTSTGPFVAVPLPCIASDETLVGVSLSVHADGGVEVVSASSDPPAPQLEDCVADALRARRFGPEAVGRRAQGWLFSPDGGVAPYEIATPGGLTKVELRAVITAHSREVRACYEQELVRTPELTGRVAVRFIVGARGEVVEADISESEIPQPSLHACILKRVRAWLFPEPIGGGKVTVTFPWILRPAGGTADEP